MLCLKLEQLKLYEKRFNQVSRRTIFVVSVILRARYQIVSHKNKSFQQYESHMTQLLQNYYINIKLWHTFGLDRCVFWGIYIGNRKLKTVCQNIILKLHPVSLHHYSLNSDQYDSIILVLLSRIVLNVRFLVEIFWKKGPTIHCEYLFIAPELRAWWKGFSRVRGFPKSILRQAPFSWANISFDLSLVWSMPWISLKLKRYNGSFI